MRLLVVELVTGGGLVGRPLAPGLTGLGDLMLRALVRDACDLPGVSVTTTRDARLPPLATRCATRRVAEGTDPWRTWADAAREADAVWPVAPESDGLLERLSALVLAAGATLLGSPPAAVRMAAGKRAAATLLARAGLRTVPTVALGVALAGGLPAASAGWVVKPDDGAGSERTALVASRAGLARRAEAAEDGDRLVVQPYVPGPAASLTLLCRDGRAALLACNSQEIAREDGALRYRGGVVGGREERREAYAPVAAGVAAAMPGLWGFVGVDLVDAEEGPVVVEVNPRVSVPYCGLREALGVNPAALLWALHERGSLEPAAGLGVRPVRLDLGRDA